MKVIIDLPNEVLNSLRQYAEKKGWNRKQYMEWQLTYHTKITNSRAEARSNGKAAFEAHVKQVESDKKYFTPKK